MLTKVDRIQDDLENLSKFNLTPNKGLTRLSFTEEDKMAREYIKKEFTLAGLQVYEDAAGNIVGRLHGKEKDSPIVMIGSHFDSVKHGGNFDGIIGVVAAMEIARVLKENKIEVNNTIEFIAMIEEEGTRFGRGLFGSSAMAGLISRHDLDNLKDENNISLADAMKNFGFDPDKIDDAIRNPKDLKAFLELHIEQGPILEKENLDIGIVDYIVGLTQIEVEIRGRADHAGTTPMDMRVDAMDTASKIISQISSFARNLNDGSVATVGKFNLYPGSANIVPSKVVFTVDIRSKNDASISHVVDKIIGELDNLSSLNKTNYNIIEKMRVKPTKLSKEIVKLFKENTDNLALSNKVMLSGAGHDAMIMAGLTDVGLLFVPSLDGRSHCKEEWTDYIQVQKATEVVLNTLLDLAGKTEK